MNYRVLITAIAEDDAGDIGKYIANELHSPQAAIDLLDEIDAIIHSLKQMPKKFALVSDKRLARMGIRSIPLGKYIVFYFVDEQSKKVVITRILYGARKWAHLL